MVLLGKISGLFWSLHLFIFHRYMVQYFLIKEQNPFFHVFFFFCAKPGITLAQVAERTVESSQTDHINQQTTETNSIKNRLN